MNIPAISKHTMYFLFILMLILKVLTLFYGAEFCTVGNFWNVVNSTIFENDISKIKKNIQKKYF
jgi:hypothetical protein